eukprot:6851103-Karenia_brevis.AAC.1
MRQLQQEEHDSRNRSNAEWKVCMKAVFKQRRIISRAVAARRLKCRSESLAGGWRCQAKQRTNTTLPDSIEHE